jgi:rubrerythrin
MALTEPPNDVFLASGRTDFECASCGYWAVLAADCTACPVCGSSALIPLRPERPSARR